MIDISLLNISLLHHITLINIFLITVRGILICINVYIVPSYGMGCTIKGSHYLRSRRIHSKDAITGFFVNPFAI